MTDVTVAVDDEFSAHKVVKPYNGTSGRGGSDASREATAREDADGTTGRRQRETLSHLSNAGSFGLTSAELSIKTGWNHHGKSSGALSVLHKEGLIARLAMGKRAGQSVYVLPEHVDGRAVAKHGGKPAPEQVDTTTGEITKAVVLTDAEVATIEGFKRVVRQHPSDKPVFSMRSANAREVLRLLEKLAR